MGGALFTLELIAECLRGPVLLPAGSGIDSSKLSSALPTLGLRLLDLPLELLEAPEGEAYNPVVSSCICFGGCGKALVFELPDQLLHEYESRGRPLAFAAIRTSTAGRSEGAAKTAGAVLLASACVDLRKEVLHAQQVARLSSEDGSNASLCPFRRCGFQLTAVHGPGSALALECLFRVYAGSHIPMTGAAVVQPAAVAAAVPVSPVMPISSARMKDCSVGSSGSSMEGSPQRDAATQTEPIAHVHAASAATALATLVLEETQRNRHSQTPAEGLYQLVGNVANVPSHSKSGDAFFADEIRVHGSVVPAHSDVPATAAPAFEHGTAAADAEAEAKAKRLRRRSSVLTEILPTTAEAANPSATLPHIIGTPEAVTPITPSPNSGAPPEAANPITPSPFGGGPPEVSPSLNLVSELVRELWQIRSISS